MPDSEKTMSDFMSNKNKEVLGEKVVADNENDDNYLTNPEIVKSSFSNESISKDDKAAMVAKNIINTLITIPIIIGSIFFVLFLLIKIGPSILNFIRGFFIRLGSLD